MTFDFLWQEPFLGLMILLGGPILVTFWPFSPIRPSASVIYYATLWNPFLVGTLVSFSGMVGSVMTYELTYKASEMERVHKMLENKYVAMMLKPFEKSVFWLIVLVAATPVPDALIGIVGGLEKYPFWKFVAANFFGRIIIYVPMAYLGDAYGAKIIDWIMSFFV